RQSQGFDDGDARRQGERSLRVSRLAAGSAARAGPRGRRDTRDRRQGCEVPGGVQSGAGLRVAAHRLREPPARAPGLQQRQEGRRRARRRPLRHGALRNRAGRRAVFSKRVRGSTRRRSVAIPNARAGGTGAPSSTPANPYPDELLTVKVRYKQPDADVSELMEQPVRRNAAAPHVPFAAAVAEFGLLLRDTRSPADRWDLLAERIKTMAGTGTDAADRQSFRDLVELAAGLKRIR